MTTETFGHRIKRSVRAATTPTIESSVGRAPVAVCAYADLDAFYAEAKQYADLGFFPATVTNQPQRAGIMRMLLLNFFALVWTPPPLIIVTYVKH